MEGMLMRLWMDDLRPAPEGYTRVYLVDETISEIIRCNKETVFLMKQYILGYMDRALLEKCIKVFIIEEISCDNDLGEGNAEGYKLLDWLEATGRNYPIRIHSANPVARERMRAIIQRNGWKEVF